MIMYRLALLAMLFKLAFPAGFMPGNLLAGEWLTLCPQGLPSGVLAEAAHHHGADTDSADNESDRSGQDQQGMCPVGSGFAMAGMASTFPACCSISGAPPQITSPLLGLREADSSYQARAPPV